MSGALPGGRGKTIHELTRSFTKGISVTSCDLVDRLFILQMATLLEIIANNHPAAPRVDSLRVLCGYNAITNISRTQENRRATNHSAIDSYLYYLSHHRFRSNEKA